MTEIFVYGTRITWGGMSSFYPQEGGGDHQPHPTLNPDGGGGPPAGAPDFPTDENPPMVAAEVTDPANAEKVQEAAKKLIDMINDLNPLIEDLADDAVIAFTDGFSMTGAQVKEWWKKADFLVTDRAFGTDRGGGVVGNLAQMNYATVEGYAAHTNGLAFIMVHDIMHMTPLARSFDQLMWDGRRAAHGDAAYDGNSEFFRRNERFVNNAAQNILDRFSSPGTVWTVDVSTAHEDPRLWFPVWGL